MKNYIYKLLIYFTVMYANQISAQTIVDITTFNQGNNQGKYFKDLNNNFDAFTGTWEYQNGNDIFRLHLHKNEQEPYENDTTIMYYKDEIVGWFELLEITSLPNQIAYENVIHKSNIRWGNDFAINAGATDGIEMVGLLQDTSIGINNGVYTRCNITLTIIPSTTPIQAEWVVELIHPAFGTHFNVPTNITMTKIN